MQAARWERLQVGKAGLGATRTFRLKQRISSSIKDIVIIRVE